MTSPRILSERYELGEILGFGGMSEVHLGRDLRLNRDVAVKVLRADLARDPTFYLRFRREAQNAAKLNHPAIVAIYDDGEDEIDNVRMPYIVMEYVDGETLRDLVRSKGPLPPRRAMEVLADVCAALDFSHKNLIVHRDMKPANIMINRSGAVKVMDFGIARAIADGSVSMTQTAAVIGTAQYLSPEQARGEQVDARSDVYSVGCVLFEILTGEPPFTGDSPVAVAYQHVREDPRTPSDVNDGIPHELDAVILKAMSKNPANRYQTAAEMRGDLIKVLGGQKPSAPTVMTEEDRTTIIGGAGSPPRRQRAETSTAKPAPLAEPAAAEPSGRSHTLLAGALAGIVVIAIALAYFFTLGPGGDSAKVTVPNVANQAQAEAVKTISDAGFTPKPTTRPHPSVPKGKVLETQPAGGASADDGSTVTVIVSDGPAPVPVPSLVGKTRAEAEAELKAKGLLLDATELVPSKLDMKDKVVAQQQPPNTPVEAGGTVKVSLGKGPEKGIVPQIPVGTGAAEAKTILAAQGFESQTQSIPSTLDKDQVVGTRPGSGSSADKGSVITIQVSDNSQFHMPDLKGKTYSEAVTELRQLGFQGEVEQRRQPDPFRNGQVIGQQYGNGSAVSKTSSITITVATVI